MKFVSKSLRLIDLSRSFNFQLALCVSLVMGTMAFATSDDDEKNNVKNNAKNSVAWKLLSGREQLQPWADEMEKADPKKIAEAWDAMEVLLRAERYDAALRLIPRAHKLFLELKNSEKYDLDRKYIVRLISHLPDEHGKLNIAFFEAFGAVLDPRNSGLITSMKDAGWDPAQITDWLYERYQASLNLGMAWLRQEQYFEWLRYERYQAPLNFGKAWLWRMAYFEWLQYRHPQGGEIFKRIKDDARQSPDDIEKRTLFLESLKYNDGLEPADVEWLLKAIQGSAYRAWIVEEYIRRGGATDINATFLERALSAPLTVDERDDYRKYIRNRHSIAQPEQSDELIQAMFSSMIMDELNRVYLSLGRAKDAQSIMLKARELRKQHNLPQDFRLAGQTQTASGQRVVEAEIKASEETDETDPNYWMDRADYYNGRKKRKEEEAALRRALALYDVAKLRNGDYSLHYRYSRVFSRLFRFLWDHGRRNEALKLFKTQRAAVRPDLGILQYMYRDCEFIVSKNGRWGGLEPLLVEDLRAAYNNLKTFPKNDDIDDGDAYDYHGGELLSRYPDLAMSSGIFNFEKDPSAWDVLLRLNGSRAFKEYVNIILLPKGGKKQTVDEKPLQKLKDLTNDGALDIGWISRISEVLQDADDYENSNWFLLAELNLAKEPERERIYYKLFSNYIAIGDWKNYEKYISLYEKLDNVRADTIIISLQHTAALAARSGARDDAERIRKRLQNLGRFP